MKINRIFNGILCTTLMLQSFSGVGITVHAAEGAIEHSTSTVTIESFSTESTESTEWMESPSSSVEGMLSDHIEEVKLDNSSIEEDEVISESSQPLDASIAEGIYGSVPWHLTKEGVLILEGGGLPELNRGEIDESPWIAYANQIKMVDIINPVVSTAFGAESLFSGLSNLSKIEGLDKLELSHSRSICQLFYQTSLKEIAVSNLNVSKVENFSFAFGGLLLKELDLSNWSFNPLADVTNIFKNTQIEKLNIGGWDIENLNVEKMFSLDTIIGEIIGEGKPESALESNHKEKDTELIEGIVENKQEEVSEELINNTTEVLDMYASVASTDVQLFADKGLQQDISNKYNLANKTIHITESFLFENTTRYYSISDNTGWLGYIYEDDIILAKGEQGIPNNYGKYVSIKGNYHIWDGFEWKTNRPGLNYQNQTFEAREYYNHFNGSRYLSLYDGKGKWAGYINELGTTVGYGAQGPHQSYGKYVNIKGNYDIWDGFEWKTSRPGLSYKNQTFEARGFYDHFNGSRYLSLYDGQGKWHGYINELGTAVGYGAQGPHQVYGKYVSVKGTYDIWNGFDWKTKKLGNEYKNKTLEASGVYQHFNGSRYLSLYDNQGKWHGYINEQGTTLLSGAEGNHQKYGKYVSLNGSYDIWQSFAWKSRTAGAVHKNKVLEARGIYNHFNGSRYLSLYDNKGKWLGYMNESGATVVAGKQGSHYSYNQLVKISAKNPIIWKNFNFKDKVSGNHQNKMYLAKGYYDHFNGSRYLSLYNNGKWVGYINESSTSKARGAASYFQTTRKQFVDSLNRNKNIYLRTPYKRLATAPYQPERLMSPIGRPNGYPPAFNCTGFVARAVRDGGGNLNKITSVANAWGGINNAYNWRDALVSRTDSISFNTVSDLLKSGLAKKGDIIYLEADFSKPNYDCHIGIFWGDTPQDNKFWHSTVAGGGNNITNIFSGTPYSKVILIPMD